MIREEAIVILQKHIDTYHFQLTDNGWYEMVRMGIARPTAQERLVFTRDAVEQIEAYELAIQALLQNTQNASEENGLDMKPMEFSKFMKAWVTEHLRDPGLCTGYVERMFKTPVEIYKRQFTSRKSSESKRTISW